MKQLSGYIVTSEVFKCYRSSLVKAIRDADQRSVLLRTFESQFFSSFQLDRYKARLENLNQLNIPGVIRFYGIEEYEGGLFIVLEHIDGHILADHIRKGPLAIREILGIGIQIAEALGALHKGNITFSGLSPKNIIIDDHNSTVKLIDLGLYALFTRAQKEINESAVRRETLVYYSPEQTGRMNRIVDTRSDFYSLGIVFFEMMTGILPFATDDPLELFHSHIAKNPDPPHSINPRVPKAISDIVMKLLAKTPEDRYQSGFGLKKDLEKCLDQLDRNDKITSFPLGKKDVPATFHLPKTLYGREGQLEILRQKLDHVIKGGMEVVLVAGYAGLGKTSLVRALYDSVINAGGIFVSGKCEQFTRDIPYSAIVKAFVELTRHILTLNAASFKVWQARIAKALEVNGQVVVDVIPEIESIIGKQPELPKLSSVESQNRFNLVFDRFLKVFTQKEHPLVLFIDDLQWIDSASLDLFNYLMTHSNNEYLYVIGAYRDNEVDQTHQLASMKSLLVQNGLKIETLLVKPLELEHIYQFIKDCLQIGRFDVSPEAVLELAKVIYKKTRGNPFYTGQLLNALCNEKLIEFDVNNGIWIWDIEKIKKQTVTENVVQFMTSQIDRFSEDTKQVLKRAACIGNRFGVELLYSLTDYSIEELALILSTLLNEGIIIPIGNSYQYLIALDNHSTHLEKIQFDFMHDRIHQAVSALSSEFEKKEIHLEIAREIFARQKETDLEERIFDIVNQFNFGAELVSDMHERLEVARLNLNAGQKAKKSAAFVSASQFLKYAIRFLPQDIWAVDYRLAFGVYAEMAEIEYLIGNHVEAEKHWDHVLANALTMIDKIQIFETKIVLYSMSHHIMEALDLGRQALRLLGIDLPQKSSYVIIAGGMIKIRWLLSHHSVEDLLDLPQLIDEHQKCIARIFIACLEPSYFADPKYNAILILKLLELSIRYGNSIYSPIAYAVYGAILCGMLADIEKGCQFGDLAIRCLEKYGIKDTDARVHYLMNAIYHWKKPLSVDLENNLMAYKNGVQAGDVAYASYAINQYLFVMFYMGTPLPDVIQAFVDFRENVVKFAQVGTIEEFQFWHQFVGNLANSSLLSPTIIGDHCDEHRLVHKWESVRDFNRLGIYTSAKQIIYFLSGKFKDAIKISRKGESYIASLMGQLFIPEYFYYYTLSLINGYYDASYSQKWIYRRKIRKHIRKMEKWAHFCPANYQHKFLIMKAGLNALKGNTDTAKFCYEQAILQVEQTEYTQDKAIIYEQAARFWFDMGQTQAAYRCLQKAMSCYQRWGVLFKVLRIKKEYPQVISS